MVKREGVNASDIPLAVSVMPAQILTESSAIAVAEAIKNFSKQHGEVGLICFDTVSRNFGPGNENATEDMTRFVYNLDRHIGKGMNRLLVHHTGHNNTERARGSSVLKAAVDVEYRMQKGETQITLSCTKMKDDPEFNDMYFQPQLIMVGGNFGDFETSIVLGAAKKISTVIEAAMSFLRDNNDATKEMLETSLREDGHSEDSIRQMFYRQKKARGETKKIFTRENYYSLYSYN